MNVNRNETQYGTYTIVKPNMEKIAIVLKSIRNKETVVKLELCAAEACSHVKKVVEVLPRDKVTHWRGTDSKGFRQGRYRPVVWRKNLKNEWTIKRTTGSYRIL